MEITPGQIAAERARLLAIIGKERPARKPGARTRYWEDQHEKAVDALRQLERGEWRPESEDDLW